MSKVLAMGSSHGPTFFVGSKPGPFISVGIWAGDSAGQVCRAAEKLAPLHNDKDFKCDARTHAHLILKHVR